MKGISRNDVSLSLIISLSYFVFWGVIIFVSTGGQITYFLKGISAYSWQIVFVTFINLYLHLLAIPFIKTRKAKWGWGILITFGIFVLLIIVFPLWQQLGITLSILSDQENNEPGLDDEVKDFLFQLFGMGYFASIKFFTDSYKLKLKNQQLDIEKKTSELNYLKSQTNPHFLFNTLNNIYSLTRDKSDLAPVSVLRLSDILRYMLYEIEEKEVPVEKEIKVIRDYIELEKLRYDDTLSVKFIVESDNPKQEIPPLLMIPLVENAFKHGVSETADMPFINIQLIIKNHTVSFTVENSIAKTKQVVGVKENIGLRNLKRQLELLFRDYQFLIEERDNSFFVSMYINLSSYAKN